MFIYYEKFFLIGGVAIRILLITSIPTFISHAKRPQTLLLVLDFEVAIRDKKFGINANRKQIFWCTSTLRQRSTFIVETKHHYFIVASRTLPSSNDFFLKMETNFDIAVFERRMLQ